jgi:protein-tyrosine phosphatase
MPNAAHNRGLCDIHCHILPGLDDGPTSLAESLEMCRQAVSSGIRTIVATPHWNGTYQPDRQSVEDAAVQLRRAAGELALPLDIIPGAEVAAAADLPELVSRNDHLTIGWQRKYVLLELPHQHMFEWINDVIFELRISGFGIIIGHPERNADVQQNPGAILPLVQSGVMTQITADSILGDLGREAKKCAAALLKMNVVHFIASDAHSLRLRPPRLYDAARKASKYIGQQAYRLICDSPLSIVRGDTADIPGIEPYAPRAESCSLQPSIGHSQGNRLQWR